MIEHKLPNKTKSATVAEPKLFHQLNNPKKRWERDGYVQKERRERIAGPTILND
jgi:hypothetical protein